MFLVRYVGAAALALPMALVLADALAGRRRRALFGAGVVLVVGAVILAYLLRNAALTGHLTGIERVAAPETHGELVRQLSIALLREAVLPLAEWQPSDRLHLAFLGAQVMAGLVALPWLIRGLQQDRPGPAFDPLTRVLLLSGAGYLVFIIAIRWLTAFDGFGFRLLAPGSLLVFLGLFRALIERIPGAARKIEGGLIVIAALSLIAMGLGAFGHGSTLPRQMQAEAARYDAVPEGAVLVFAGLHAPFLRSDLHVSAPNPFSASGLPEDSESWSDFLASPDPDCPVWLDMTGAPGSASTHHPSVLNALEGLPTGALIELRAPVAPAT
jgi:asparagine N-glycosylation enzyme membrane subunit Stt3